MKRLNVSFGFVVLFFMSGCSSTPFNDFSDKSKGYIWGEKANGILITRVDGKIDWSLPEWYVVDPGQHLFSYTCVAGNDKKHLELQHEIEAGECYALRYISNSDTLTVALPKCANNLAGAFAAVGGGCVHNGNGQKNIVTSMCKGELVKVYCPDDPRASRKLGQAEGAYVIRPKG